MNLNVQTDFDGERAKVSVFVKPDGVHLYFLKEQTPRTFRYKFHLVLTKDTIIQQHMDFANLAYETGWSRKESMTIPDVQGYDDSGLFKLLVTIAGLRVFKLQILDGNATQYFEIKLTLAQMVNIFDEAKRFLIEPIRE